MQPISRFIALACRYATSRVHALLLGTAIAIAAPAMGQAKPFRGKNSIKMSCSARRRA